MSKGNYILYYIYYCNLLHGATWKPYKASNYLQSSHKHNLNPNITKHMSKDLSMNPEIVRDKGIRYLYIYIYYNIL